MPFPTAVVNTHARKRIGVGRDHLGDLSQSRSRPRTDKHEPESEAVCAMTIAGSKRVVIVMRDWRASQVCPKLWAVDAPAASLKNRKLRSVCRTECSLGRL